MSKYLMVLVKGHSRKPPRNIFLLLRSLQHCAGLPWHIYRPRVIPVQLTAASLSIRSRLVCINESNSALSSLFFLDPVCISASARLHRTGFLVLLVSASRLKSADQHVNYLPLCMLRFLLTAYDGDMNGQKKSKKILGITFNVQVDYRYKIGERTNSILPVLSTT
jgi:hypothetical protein